MSIPNVLSREWQALAASDKVLFYNNRKRRLEGMSYKNDFHKFFKIIWYYLCGRTRNSDRLFSGIESLYSRTLIQYSSSDKNSECVKQELLGTIKKVHEITMTRMISQFKRENEKGKSLAASLLKLEVEKLMKQIQFCPPKEEKIEEEKVQISRTPKAPPSIRHVINEPLQPQPPTESTLGVNPPQQRQLSAPQNSEIPKPPPPFNPPPPHPSSAGMKEKKIQMAKSEIETEKKLIEYLKLTNLKSHATYKKLGNVKINLDILQRKLKEQARSEQVEQAVTILEAAIVKAGENEKVDIIQDGELIPFDAYLAKQTLQDWKKQLEEINSTKLEINKQMANKQLLEKESIKQDEFEISCGDIDQKLEKFLLEMPKIINENKGLKFHLSRLETLENKLGQLEGKPKVKKRVEKAKQPTVHNPLQEKKSFNKEVAADFATAAAEFLKAKATSKPSLNKIVSSM